MQNLILSWLAPISNLGNEKQRLMWHFLFGLFRFLPILIKFTFLIFMDTSGRRMGNFFPDPGDGEKLAGTFKKKSSQYLNRNYF